MLTKFDNFYEYFASFNEKKWQSYSMLDYKLTAYFVYEN